MTVTTDNIDQLDFSKGEGLLPAIVQDRHTGRVLMLGYMNTQALLQTLQTGKITFYSRSKKRLWVKGESSGNFLHLHTVKADCDADALLISATPEGPVCHTGSDTCWAEDNHFFQFLPQLERVIADRKTHPKEGSYTSSLFARGINKVAQKVGEEAVELVIESKDDNKDLFLGEAADLLFHFLVLLAAKGYTLEEVEAVLRKRNSAGHK